jgi:ribonucleotide reductase alpha subunit
MEHDQETKTVAHGAVESPRVAPMVCAADNAESAASADLLKARLTILAQTEPALDPHLDLDLLVRRVIEGTCPGMTDEESQTLLAETSVALSSSHLDYEKLAARVAVAALHARTPSRFSDAMALLAANTERRTGRRAPLVSDELVAFVAAHRDALDAAIVHDRDFDLTYFGLMTLKRSYLISVHDTIVERPQYMRMRVAIGHYGFAGVEDALAHVLSAYDAMSRQLLTSATPTLFNAGTPRPQNSSCFLLDMKEDSISGIYDTLKQCALISKAAGGVGFAAHQIRAAGSYVAGTNGQSNGLVPMLRVFNDTARYVDQCFSGDALVMTAERGPVPIGVLYREGAIRVASGPTPTDTSDQSMQTMVVPLAGVKVLSDDGRWCPLKGVVRHAPSLSSHQLTYLVGAGTNSIPRWAMPGKDALRFRHGVRVTPEHQVQVLCDRLNGDRLVVVPAEATDSEPPTYTPLDGDDANDAEDDNHHEKSPSGKDRPDLDARLDSLCERINRGYVVPKMVDAHDLVPGAVLCVPIPPEPVDAAPPLIAHSKPSDWRMAGILYAAEAHGAVQIGARVGTKTSLFVETYLAVAEPDGAASSRPKNGVCRWRMSHPGFATARSLIARSILALASVEHIECFVRGVYEGLDEGDAPPHLVDTLRWLTLRLATRSASFCPDAVDIAAGKAAVLSCALAPSPLSVEPTTDGSSRVLVVPWTIVHGNVTYVPVESIDTITFDPDAPDAQQQREALLRGSGAEGDDGALYDLEVDDPNHTYTVLGFGACHNGGGKRKGAFACYLEPWHADIVAWLDLKKNHGKEEDRARDLYYGLWTCDLFMRRMVTGRDWSLFCPAEAPGLDQCHGAAFDALYERYEREGRARSVIPAQQLWTAVVSAQIETGTPYLLHKDAFNLASNQQNLGTTVCSNLCTEIGQHSSPVSVATCLTGDTLVATDKGLVRLDACDGANVLVPFKTDKDLTDAPHYERATLIDNGVRPVFCIETKDGAPLEATADHRMLIVAGRDCEADVCEFRWERVDGLRPGDKIATGTSWAGPHFDVDRSTNIDSDREHEAYLAAGWYLGGGCGSDGAGATYPNFAAFFDAIASVKQTSALGQPTSPHDNTTDAASCGSLMTEIGDKFGFATDCDGSAKRIGATILAASGKEQAAFLSGLFCAGGCVTPGSTPSVTLSSTSRGLLHDAQLMLGCFGVSSKISRSAYESNGTVQDTLCISDGQAISALHRYIGFRPSPQKQAALDTTLGFTHTEKIDTAQQRYQVIESITPVGDKHVYDLSVPDGHHFVANGKVSHNCNLSSIALPKFVVPDPRGTDRTATLDARYDDAGVGLGMVFDHGALHDVVQAAVRNLNRVIDINYYPLPEAKHSNLQHRPMGVGVQGLADVFALMDLPWESAGARRINRDIFETIYHAAVTASARLAAKDGPYPSYYEGTYIDGHGNEVRGSPASRGLLHPDLWAASVNDMRRWAGCDRQPGDAPGKGIPVPPECRRPFDPKKHESGRWGWEGLRALVKQHGLRNSLLVAVMPTASTSQILGNTEACEVITSNIYSRRVLSGDFTVINRHLVRRMVDRGLWTADFRDRLIAAQGSVQGFSDEEVPPDLKALFKTVWEVPNRVTIDMAADRAPYVDQSQSLNLYCAKPTLGVITSMHAYAWRRGLKTGMYYLRTRPAANAIQFTVDRESIPATGPAVDVLDPISDHKEDSMLGSANADADAAPVLTRSKANIRAVSSDVVAGDVCYPGCESCSG